jgi:hypothetical protein
MRLINTKSHDIFTRMTGLLRTKNQPLALAMVIAPDATATLQKLRRNASEIPPRRCGTRCLQGIGIEG